MTFKARAREETSELVRDLQPMLSASAKGVTVPGEGPDNEGPDNGGGGESNALDYESGDNAIRDAELLLASLRMLLLLALAIAPRILHIEEAYKPSALLLMTVAGVYNIFTIVASIYPARFRLRRALIVAMDATLISAWIHISGRWDLLPFYYVVVVVAAMWYRVLGGVIVAAVCNFLWLLLWLLPLARQTFTPSASFNLPSMALNSVLFFIIGALAGYIAEAQDREREQSLERELLIANYQQEIDLSGELQPLLLSRLEKGGALNDLDIGAALQSARDVGGGDYLDAIPLPDGTTLLCIADVSGKSIRAQARVPLLKYSLRALAPLHPQPAELMARLQTTLLPDLGPELYIAVCLVVVNSDSQSLTWCNAGHLAPLLVRGSSASPAEKPKGKTAPLDDNLLELAATAPALGLFPEMKIAQKSIPWSQNDWLLMFTDGLPDALSFGGATDGEAQVQALARGLRESQSKAIAASSQTLTVPPTAPPTAAEIANELVGLAGVALGDEPFVARHFTLVGTVTAKNVHRDDVAVLIARNTSARKPN